MGVSGSLSGSTLNRAKFAGGANSWEGGAMMGGSAARQAFGTTEHGR